jgi:large subunit ribosomal protein L13
MRTFSAKPGEIAARWFIVDAADKPLGRTASKIAMMLQGKNKPSYTPHVDTGDFVVVINAAKIRLTGRKLDEKIYHRHTGWVGGLVSTPARELLKRKPTELMRLAVKGMLPKTRLAKDMLNKLKVHAGPCPEHGYAAQKAEQLEL